MFRRIAQIILSVKWPLLVGLILLTAFMVNTSNVAGMMRIGLGYQTQAITDR